MADGEQIKDDVQAKIDAKKAKWESEWAALDFSWAGLADAAWDVVWPDEAQELKRWQAPVSVPVDAHVIGDGENAFKQATLQDYWRWVAAGCGDSLASDADLRAAGLLIEVDGTDWFALHRPEVRASVALDGDAPAPDMRSETTAGAALAPLLMQALDAGGDTLGEVKYGKEDLRGPDHRVQLVGARAHGLDAMWREFSGEGEEKRPLHVNAARAHFEILNARGSSFGALASFSAAHFAGPAIFTQAQFSGDADFKEALFSGTADFIQAQFSGLAVFEKAQFSGNADFWEAQFSGLAVFNQAQFSGHADFRQAQFSGLARFEKAQFSGTAWFEKAQFSGDAGFWEAQFSRLARFNQARFAGPVSFAGKRKDGASRFLRDFRFTNAVFADTADFSDTQLPHGPHAHQAFEGAHFHKIVQFKNFDLIAFAAFDGAVFEKTIILDDPGEKLADQHFRTALKAAEAAGKNEPDREAYLAALEGGLRTLKLAMSRVFDRQREQMFYRFELRTRRARPSTPWWEKAASYLFAGLSDYGGSILLPLVWLCVFTLLVFPAVYRCFGHELALGGASCADAMGFSMAQTFRPFGVWSGLSVPAAPAGGWDGAPFELRLAYGAQGWWWVLIRLIATLQSFVSLVMLFLFGLAVRRRFQIN